MIGGFRVTTLCLSAVVFCGACTDASAPPDAAMDSGDAVDAPSDATADSSDGVDSSLSDADAACELTSRLSCGTCDAVCGAREGCAEGACGCEADDVLCSTKGFATFPIPDPARSGAPRPADYLVVGDTVEDLVTALVWQRSRTETKRTFRGAWSHCAALDLTGRDDYRLPSRVELASILDATRTPSIDRDAFPDTPDDYFWTSSLVPGTEGSAYGMYFGGGEVVTAAIDAPSAYVRCVAGDASPPTGAQHEAGAETTTDRGTGLIWMRGSLGPMPHAAAATACAETDLSGGAGRVPTITELMTIIDESRADPALDSALFDASGDDILWSATTRDLGAIVAWGLEVTDGQTSLHELDEAHYVRCVR